MEFHSFPIWTEASIQTEFKLHVIAINVHQMSPWLHPRLKTNHTFFSGMQPTQKVISRMSCDSQGSTGPKKCLNTRLKSLHPSKEWNRQHSEDYVLWLLSFVFDTIWRLCCLCGRNSGWCSWMNPLYHDSQSILYYFMAVCQTWL